MGQIGKGLRWLFGIEALLFAAISARFLSKLPNLLLLEAHSHKPPVGKVMGFSSGSAMVATGLAVTLTLTVVYGMAWWRLGAGKATARLWALAASLVSIPFFLIGSASRLITAAGIVGLVVFSRRSSVAITSARAVKTARLPGDGTSGALEWIAQAALFNGVFFAAFFWDHWAAGNGLPKEQSLLLRLLLIGVAMLITTAVHELGHALAALALNMKVRHFLVGPCEWSVKGGKWKFHFHAAGLLSGPGAVGAVPVNLEDMRWRLLLFTAAGPLASLWLGAVAMWATFAAKGLPWEPSWKFLSYVTTFALLGFILNFVPIATEGQYSDGARIYQLLSRRGWGDVYQSLSMIGSALVTPLRPRDFDNQILERAALFLQNGQKAFLLRMNSWTHFYDSGRIPEALQALAEAESVYTRSALNLPASLHMELVFANALVKCDRDAARMWWDRMEAKNVEKKEAKKETESSVDYWKARCALLLVEGRLTEAESAWERGNALAKGLPSAGAYEFDRFCFARLRKALEVATPPPVPQAESVLVPA